MLLLKFSFWISLFIIFYTYFGYGLLVMMINRIKSLFGKKPLLEGYEPPVTLVVSAYNEEDFIEQKIQNTLTLDYPVSKLSLIFITDGSQDATADIVARYTNILLLHQPERRGKVAAMHRAMEYVKTPIVVFSDANTLLNKESIRRIAAHYGDPKVGGVAGEKKIAPLGDAGAANAGEGIYWKYESWLKKMDSDLYSVVGAAGELFSLRSDLFEILPENTIIEDFVLSLRICLKGFVVRYEPGAFAMETGSASMKEEQKRKIRICAGAFQAMQMLKKLFNFFKYPLLSFQFISHRILRWTLCPLATVFLLISNIIIVLVGEAHGFYFLILSLQLLFYILAGTGWVFANRNIRVKVLYVPYYFLFMNISVFLGFSRFVRKKQSVLWEKASRQKIVKIP
jgi:biofilm PGA synthesis N-glycosyltransferase PgaC